MKPVKERKSIRNAVKHFVPNNPAFDKEYNLDNGMDRDAFAYAKANTLYDIFSRYGTRRTASGKWRERDEPPEHIQLKQADMIRKQLQSKRAAAGRERLKAANKVPTKSGAKLFEDFCREAYRNKKQNIDDANMRNIFNAAQHLSYEKWIWFVNDEYASRI